MLDAYHLRLLEAARQWRQGEITVVYGLLPSSKLEEIAAVMKASGRVDMPARLLLRGVQARHGDEAAQAELLGLISTLRESSAEAPPHVLSEAIGYVQTEKMQRILAAGLRSADRIDCAGGGWLVRRSLYALALTNMMWDDPTFPVKHRAAEHTDEELDKIEAWCTEKLGVTFPGTPRPKPIPPP